METNKKYIIIALVALILALGSVFGYMVMFHVDYERVHISSTTTIEVPKYDDVSWSEEEGIKLYSCPSKGVVMQSVNSQENLSLAGAIAYAGIRDGIIENSTSVELYHGYDIRLRTINGTDFYVVSISNNETHDNILILSKNLDILKHMIDSIEFGKPTFQANLTSDTPSVTIPSNTSKNNSNMYSEYDLMNAAQYGYLMGYYDGYDDSYYYYDDYDYYDSYDGGGSSSTPEGGQSEAESVSVESY